MDKVRSLYLELLRILAAFYVFIYHFGSVEIGYQACFATNDFNERMGLEHLGAHYFVIVFFVLSGYLIALSANKPYLTFRKFISSRMGRLYSVLIPSLLFTYLVYFLITAFHIYPRDTIQNSTNLLPRFFLNLTFLSQSWNLCSTPPLNTPYWSVAYEFMYYLIFGTFLLTRKPLNLILPVLLVLVTGLKVVMLLPAWLIGSFLFYFSSKRKSSLLVSSILFLVSLTLLLIVITKPASMPLAKNEADNNLFGFNLFFSWNYLADYFFALIVAVNMYGLFGISKKIYMEVQGYKFDLFYRLVKVIGNCTYTLYLFHVPLLFFFSALLPYDKSNSFHQLILIVLVMLSVYFIARQTEWKVDLWRSFVDKSISLVREKLSSTIQLVYKRA